MLQRPRTLALAAVLSLAFVVTACSGDDDSGKSKGENLSGLSGVEVRDAVIDDMAEVDSMRIVADVAANGGTTRMEVALDRDGRCAGTMTVNDGTAEIASDGTSSFIRGDDEFWVNSTGDEGAAAEATALLDGKWARFPAAQLGDVCSLDSILEGMTKKGGATVELGDVVDHDGVKALEVNTTSAEGETSFGLVAYEGEHHLLKVERVGDEGGSFVLSDFNKPVDVTVPAEGEFVDMETLAN